MKPLRDRIRKVFDYDTIDVCPARQEIRVYYYRDPRGREWVPYGAGPLYGESAIDQAAWLADHVEKYRDLLPKECRAWKIVYGELSTRTYPGQFYPVPRKAVSV